MCYWVFFLGGGGVHTSFAWGRVFNLTVYVELSNHPYPAVTCTMNMKTINIVNKKHVYII